MVRIQSTGQLKRMKIAVEGLEKKRVSVGWFDTAKYSNGVPVAYVAAIQEFGYPTGGIPARPFVRPTLASKKTQWSEILKAGGSQVVKGAMTVDQMLGQFGMLAAGNISEAIAAVSDPALAASTIRARAARRASPGASIKPLVDTGLMIQSVSSRVEDV